MAYENIKFNKPNMVVSDGYFYYLDESKNSLIVKLTDGDTAFEYPTNVTVGAQIKSLQHDGHYFWSLQDDNDGFIIKCWEVDNYICKLENTFSYTDTTFINYQSSAFGVEHYITDLSQTLTARNFIINISEYYDSVLVSGTNLTLGPNASGDWEHVTVSGVVDSNVYLTDRVKYLYSAGDKVCITKSLFVFNDYQGTSSSKGTLFRFDAYTGDYISAAYDVDYQNVSAATFTRIQNTLLNYPDAHTLIYIKSTNAKFRNMSDLINILDSTSANDDFTGSNSVNPDSQLWYINYGNPEIQNNKLFMSCLPGTSDQIISNYLLLGDFEAQVSGSLNYGDNFIYSFGSYKHYMLVDFLMGATSKSIGVVKYEFEDPTSNGLVLEYTMDLLSSATLYDGSGYNLHGTLSSTTKIVQTTGKLGKCLDFTPNSYVSTTSNSVLDITNNLSISVWVNVDSFNSYGGIICYGSDGTDWETYSLNTLTSPNRVFFGTNWPDTWYQLTTVTTLNTGTWYHIVATFNSGEAKIYVNGNLDNSTTFGISTLPLSSSRVLMLGKHQPGTDEYFNGKIDQLRIFNRVLSDDEIVVLAHEVPAYRRNKPGFYSSSAGVVNKFVPFTSDCLELWYTLTSGTLDSSGNNRHGTVFGATPTIDRFSNPNSAYYFDGVDDYIALDYFYKDPDIGPFSVSAWVKVPIDGGNWSILDFDRSEYFTCAVGIVDQGAPSEGDYIGFHTADTDYVQSNMWSAYSGIRDNNWHHVVWVYDGTTKYIYIDGQQDPNTQDVSVVGTGIKRYGFIGDGSEAYYFDGARNYTNFKGSIDDVRLYSKGLSQLEVEVIYKGLDVIPNNKDYYLRLDRSGSDMNFYYKDTTLSGVYSDWILLDSLTVSTIDCNISLGLTAYQSTISGADFDDFVINNGYIIYPEENVPYYGIANIDNVKTDQSTLITIYDIDVSNGTLYRLQDEGTYYGSDNSWSTYNYQPTTLRSFIDFITVGADPIILPANGKNVSIITALVNDQYGNPANNRPVIFTEDNDVGFMTSPVVYTGDYNYNPGEATGVYKAGTDVTTVTIEGTVTQYD